jgi:hypothetical protein
LAKQPAKSMAKSQASAIFIQRYNQLDPKLQRLHTLNVQIKGKWKPTQNIILVEILKAHLLVPF